MQANANKINAHIDKESSKPSKWEQSTLKSSTKTSIIHNNGLSLNGSYSASLAWNFVLQIDFQPPLETFYPRPNGFELTKYENGLSDLIEKAEKTVDKWDEVVNFDPAKYRSASGASNIDNLDFEISTAEAIIDQGRYWPDWTIENSYRALLNRKKKELDNYNTQFLKYFFSLQDMAKVVWKSRVSSFNCKW